MRTLCCVVTVLAVGLACRDDRSAAQTKADGYAAYVRRNALPPPAGGRTVELVSSQPPTVFNYGPLEVRVAAEVPEGEGGHAVAVKINKRVISGDSVRYTPFNWDLRLYPAGRTQGVAAYSWVKDRLSVGAPSVILLSPDDTIGYRLTMRGYEIGPEVRAGPYELRAAALADIGRDNEIVVGVIRVGKDR